MQLNGSQIFVEVLCEQGVDTIFGYPGGAVLNLYDELYKNAHRITMCSPLTSREPPMQQTATPGPPAAPAWCWPPAARVHQPGHRHRHRLYGLGASGGLYRQRSHPGHRQGLLSGSLH